MIVVSTSAGEMENLDCDLDVLYRYTLVWNGKNYKMCSWKHLTTCTNKL